MPLVLLNRRVTNTLMLLAEVDLQLLPFNLAGRQVGCFVRRQQGAATKLLQLMLERQPPCC